MNYAGIKYCDIANGIGCRTVLFVSGCRNHCKNCFQPQTWAFDYGNPFDRTIQDQILDSLEPDYVRGLTVLGGEPFEPENQAALLPFLKEVRTRFPSKDIWVFTGYVMDRDLAEGGRKHTGDTDAILSLIDILVDGPFVEEEKDITLRFRGSRNQRIIDVPESIRQGHIVRAVAYEERNQIT